MKTRELVLEGFKACINLNGDYEQMADLLKIRNLNARASAAWIRGNNSGHPGYLGRMELKADKCLDRARAIAGKHGWKISAPGLWWGIRDSVGQDITLHI